MNQFRNHRLWLVKDIFLVSESLRLFLTKYQYRHRFKTFHQYHHDTFKKTFREGDMWTYQCYHNFPPPSLCVSISKCNLWSNISVDMNFTAGVYILIECQITIRWPWTGKLYPRGLSPRLSNVLLIRRSS